MKKVIAVSEFMEKLDHPFKAEVQTLRDVIKNVNKDIVEEIKWNAPSFSFHGESLVTFKDSVRAAVALNGEISISTKKAAKPASRKS